MSSPVEIKEVEATPDLTKKKGEQRLAKSFHPVF